MALSAAGSHASAPSPVAACPTTLTKTHPAHAPRIATPRACRCQLPSVSTQSLSGAGPAAACTAAHWGRVKITSNKSGRHRLPAAPRAPPTAASATGAAPGPGHSGHSSSQQPHGAASSSGQPFNPRYHHHSQRPQQVSQPLHSHSHSHAHTHTHHQQHPKQQHAPGSMSGRGAWATPGPLAPSASGPQPGPNPRHESPLAPPLPQPRPASSSSPRVRPLGSDESRLVAAGAGAAVAAPPPPQSSSLSSSPFTASTGMSVTAAAARQGPRSGRPSDVPYQPSAADLQEQQQLNGQLQILRGLAPPSPHQPEDRGVASGAIGGGGGPQSQDAGSSSSATPKQQCRTQLERLYIRDFALVSEQTVRLGPGVNVITGESGSGKSVLVEAFSQVLGAPAPQECVRAPAEMAVIEGSFLVGSEQWEAVGRLLSACGLPQKALAPPLRAGGGGGGGTASINANASCSSSSGSSSGSDAGPGGAFHLTVRREISHHTPGGGLRSRVFLNGCPSSLRVLRELGALLVDTNGQHSAASLRDAATQLDLLDRIAGTSALADSYCAALERLRQLEGRLDELDELDDEQERTTMQKLVDAVAKLRIQPGEERELRRTLKKMEARRSAVEQCGLVRMALCGEAGAGGVTDALRTIEAQLNAILAQEELNRPAAGFGSATATAASAAAKGEDEAGEEGEEEGEEEEGGGSAAAAAAAAAAAGARMMEEALEQVAAAKDMLATADATVRAYARRYQFSQADHDATSERLARIERLMKQASAAGFGAGPAGGGGSRGRGFGGGPRLVSTEQLLEVAAECSSKLAAYYEMAGQREEWEAQLQTLVADLRATALALSSRRRAAAAALRSAVEGCLRELAMGGSRFDVRIGWVEERLPPPAGGAAGAGAGDAAMAEGLYVSEEEAEQAGVTELGGRTYVMGPRGLDQVEFLLAAGPAEPLRPLAAVASGGESARVMLALKAAPAQAVAAASASAASGGGIGGGGGGGGGVQLAAAAPAPAGGGVPIMILDELDSGIGARLGSAVGSILARMAQPSHGPNSQIICVTHLPQVACYAAHHIKVQKELRPLLNHHHQQQQQLSAAAAAAASSAPIAPAAAAADSGGGTPPVPPVEAAAAAAARVTTTFVPLRTFEDRSEEVAAMLGLDRAVAEEMLWAAQSQVAAMYPPEKGASTSPTLLDGFPALARQPRRSGGSAAAPAGPSAAATEGSDVDDAGAVASRRVVQDALRSGSGDDDADRGALSSSFSVVVAPAMDPNAVLIGADAAAASDATAYSEGGHEAAAEEEEAEEAELSAQLLAGVEAAAMQHLQRMEAQAKAAAAAAAAAAAIVVPTAAAGVVQEAGRNIAVGSRSGRVEAAPGAEGADGSRLSAGLGTFQQPTSPASHASSSTTLGATVDLSGLPPAVGGAGATAAQSAAPKPSFVVAVQPSRSPLPYNFGGGEDGGEDVDEGAAAAAVQVAARSPLPYDFGGGDADGDVDDDGNDVMAAATTASRSPLPYNFGGASTTVHNAGGFGNDRIGGDPGISHSPHGGTGHQAQDQQQQPLSYDNTSGAEYEVRYFGAAQAYGAEGGGEQYMYGVGDSGGGSFVAVPSEHEAEFQDMFQAIMSFSREDYAGEALRTQEATLMEALRDAGLA